METEAECLLTLSKCHHYDGEEKSGPKAGVVSPVHNTASLGGSGQFFTQGELAEQGWQRPSGPALCPFLLSDVLSVNSCQSID